jgi:cyclopropane fatty-acyl-phospholipid synthase-like methyltransferase
MPASPSDRARDATVDIVRRGYNSMATGYLAAVRAEHDGAPREVWTALLHDRLPAGARVLDVGCGPGVPTAAAFVACGDDVLGVDVSERQIELARTNVPGARFELADVTRWDGVAEGSVDAVVALYSLTHVPRDEYPELFGRFVRWLRPGGWFLASLGRSDSAGWDEEDFLGFAGTSSFTNSYGVDDTVALLRSAGLDIERSELVDDETPFGPEQWLWVLARSEF